MNYFVEKNRLIEIAFPKAICATSITKGSFGPFWLTPPQPLNLLHGNKFTGTFPPSWGSECVFLPVGITTPCWPLR